MIANFTLAGLEIEGIEHTVEQATQELGRGFVVDTPLGLRGLTAEVRLR